METSDADAILASARDPGAFGVLFDRHATTVFRYVVRRVGPDDADDLLSEVFRLAFELRERYDTTRPSARPWLYGIATNVIARHRRRDGRRASATARAGARREHDDDVFDRSASALDAARVLPEVLRAIAELPAGEQDALLLHVWEGLSYDDVASALDIPVGTVRSRLNRARGRLRDLADVAGDQRPDRVLPVHPTHPIVFRRGKERLMSSITGATPQRPAVTATRMYPRLTYRDEVAALEYLTRVFGFTEQREARMGEGGPDDPMLAWLEFGDGVVMIGRDNDAVHDVHHIYSPAEVGRSTVMINVDVVNIDEHYAHAVAEGADITMPIEDAFYGHRRYEASDLDGHRWHFSEPLESIRARGGAVAGQQ